MTAVILTLTIEFVLGYWILERLLQENRTSMEFSGHCKMAKAMLVDYFSFIDHSFRIYVIQMGSYTNYLVVVLSKCLTTTYKKK